MKYLSILLVGLLAVTAGCQHIEKVKEDYPLVYEAGQTAIKLALQTAVNEFLAKNPDYAPVVRGLDDILVGTTPQEARAVIAERIPDPEKRDEFAVALAGQIDVETPSAPPEEAAWLVDVALGL